MEATAASAVDWLARHGPLLHIGLFVAMLVDATGVPFPGRVLLVAAGATLARDPGDAAALIAVSALGALVGDHAWYAVGRLGGDRLMRVYCALSLASRRCERRARASFERLGPWAIVAGRFFASVRAASAPLVATGAISYPRYLAYETLGAVLWSAVFVILGYALGDQWRAMLEQYGIGTALAVAGGITAAGIAAVVAVRALRRRRHGPASAGSSPRARRRTARRRAA